MLDIEKRRRNRFGVSANVLRLRGLNLESPSKVWVGEVIGRPHTGDHQGVFGWEAEEEGALRRAGLRDGGLWLTSTMTGAQLWFLCGCYPGGTWRKGY